MKSKNKSKSKGPTTAEIMATTGCAERTAARLRQRIKAEGSDEPLDIFRTAKKWQGRRWKAMALMAELELAREEKKVIAFEDIAGLFMIANETMNFSWQAMLEELPIRIVGRDIIDVRIELEKSINAALHRYKDTFDKFANDHRPIREIAADPNLPVIIKGTPAN